MTSSVISIGSPSSSFPDCISKECRTEAINKNREPSPRCRPGQILMDVKMQSDTSPTRHTDYSSHLRPNPKAIVAGSRTSGLILPFLMKRSGLNLSGSGYSSGLRSIALKTSGGHSCAILANQVTEKLHTIDSVTTDELAVMFP